MHSLSFQRDMYCPQASPTQPKITVSACLPSFPQPLYEWFLYLLTLKLEAQSHPHPSHIIHSETNHYQQFCNQSSSPASCSPRSGPRSHLDPPKIFLKFFPVSILPLPKSLHATVDLVFLKCKYDVTSWVKISQWLPIAYGICPPFFQSSLVILHLTSPPLHINPQTSVFPPMTYTFSHTPRLLHLPLPLSEITFPLFSGWWISPKDSDFNASVRSPVTLFLQRAPLLATWANLVASTYHTFLVFPMWSGSWMRAGILSFISSNLPWLVLTLFHCCSIKE